MAKIIFLDVDGVLNNAYSKASVTDEFGTTYVGAATAKIKKLKKIVKATDAILVLSSDWRFYSAHMTYLSNKLRKNGMRIMSTTPDISRSKRGAEIRKWFRSNNDLNVEQWIVLDDEIFSDFYDFTPGDPLGRIMDHLVKTKDFYDTGGGLQDMDVEKAIKMLNGEIEP